LASRRLFERTHSPTVHETVINEAALREFEASWIVAASRLQVIPGKEVISAVNGHLQKEYGINVTATAIIDSMKLDEIPAEMRVLVEMLREFSALKAK
jgi:hypothetical protein